MDALTIALLTSIFGGPIALLVGLAVFPWRRPEPRHRWILLVLAPPILSLIWGVAFRVTPGFHPNVSRWIVAVPWLSFLAATLLSIATPYLIGRTFRLSSFALSLAALAATVLTTFSALMSVTGDYI